MEKRLQQRLFYDCPILFQLGIMGRNAPRELQYGITLGFQCNSGWYNLIRKASLELEQLNREHKVEIVAHQVKEKFGTLRYYLGPVPSELSEKVSAIIREAEKASEVTCEVCGKNFDEDPTVQLRTKGPWTTNCKMCYGERTKNNPRFQDLDDEDLGE